MKLIAPISLAVIITRSSRMKLIISIAIISMVVVSSCSAMPRKVMNEAKDEHGVSQAIAEGPATSLSSACPAASTDNHHQIPRDQYNNWSSPGNMPGSGGDSGERMSSRGLNN